MIIFSRDDTPRSIEASLLEKLAADDWGGSTTDTGIKITPKSAYKHHAAWRAINLIAGTIARVPCHIYRIDSDRNKIREPRHPAYQLIRYQPAPEINAAIWYQTMMGHVLTRGNHYSYILRDGGGSPVELWPLNPDAITVCMEGGRLWYVYAGAFDDRMQPRRLDFNEVLHIKGMGFDGLVGYSVISYMANSLATGLAAEKFGNKFFRNGATPKIVLSSPNKITTDQANQVRDHWQSMQAGLDNSHKTAILQNGMEPKTLTLNPQESQLLETKKFSVIEISNWFGVPPHKLGDSSRTAYNSIEAENQSFLDESLDRWLVGIEQEFRAKLLTEGQKRGDTHVIEFQRDALVRANLAAKASYYRQAAGGHPWETVNEIRRKQNLPTLGEKYDALIPPNNNFGSGEASARSIEAARESLQYVIDKMRVRVSKAFGQRLKRHGDPAATMAEVKRDNDGIVRDNLRPSIRTLCELTGDDEAGAIEAAISAIYSQEKKP